MISPLSSSPYCAHYLMTILIIMNGNSIMIIFHPMLPCLLGQYHFLMCVDSCEHIDYLMLHFRRHFLRYFDEEVEAICLYGSFKIELRFRSQSLPWVPPLIIFGLDFFQCVMDLLLNLCFFIIDFLI